MYQNITQSMFIDAFHDCGRDEQFSYGSLCALFEFFEECDPDMELDVIAICCEFAEYADVDELQQAYGIDDTGLFGWDEWVEYLSDKTTVLVHAGGLTLASF